LCDFLFEIFTWFEKCLSVKTGFILNSLNL